MRRRSANFTITSAPPLPYDSQVAYLANTASSNGAYIDTGWKPTDNTQLIFKYKYNTSLTTDQYVAGARVQKGVGDSIQNLYVGRHAGSANRLYFAGYGADYAYISATTGADVEIEMSFLDSGCSVKRDGVNVYTVARHSLSVCDIDLILFGRNDGHQNPPVVNSQFVGKLYYFQIIDGATNQLIRDFVPVRIGQEGCLYDRVSGTVFHNPNHANCPFVLGGDVND